LDDYLEVLEAILSKLIAVLEAAKMGENIIIEADSYTTACVDAFAQAYSVTVDDYGDTGSDMLKFVACGNCFVVCEKSPHRNLL
jgi:hypothetical protein